MPPKKKFENAYITLYGIMNSYSSWELVLNEKRYSEVSNLFKPERDNSLPRAHNCFDDIPGVGKFFRYLASRGETCMRFSEKAKLK